MERLTFKLDDARPPVLLAQRRLVDRLPELKAAGAVCIDELSSRQAQGIFAFAPTRGTRPGSRYLSRNLCS